MITSKSASDRKHGTASDNSHSFVRQLPHALELEAAVLGAVLLSGKRLADVTELLQPETFYDPKHRHVFDAIRGLETKGATIDLLTVTEELRAKERLEGIGGAYYLTKLTMDIVSAAHLEAHAGIIHEKYLLRETIALANQATNEAYHADADAFDVLNNLNSSLTSLTVGGMSQSYATPEALAALAMEDLDHIVQHKDRVTGIPTGYRRLDELTNGWQPGNLIIIASRPGLGKTAFVQNLLINAAQHPVKPVPVALFSLEMSNSELMKRWLVGMSNVDLNHVNSGKLDQSEIDRYMESATKFGKLPIFVDDQPALNIFQLRAKARRLKQKHDIQMIVVDYLQLMTGTGSRNGNREQEISTISRELKALAKELRLPIIALSQLNRAVEGRQDKTPQLSDLRESGAIEQDANVVLFLTRPDYQKTLDEMGDTTSLHDNADIHVRKNRMGGLDDIPMYFVKPIQRWFDRVGYDDYKGTSHFKSSSPDPNPYSSAITGHYQRAPRDFNEPMRSEEEPGDLPF